MSKTGRARLRNRSAVIVGGGQTPGETIGNGRATAITFAREGAKVVVVDINLPAAEETCAMIEAEGGHAVSIRADMTRSEDCEAFVEECTKTFGTLDILVNSAAVNDGDNDIAHLDEASWERIQSINVKGVFLSCRAAIRVMQKQRSGSIINISSTAALWSGDPYVAYNTSKAAVNGLTRSLVIDCARHGIRINAIMPGLMRTPMGIDAVVREKNVERAALIRSRDEAVPLKGKMGEAWDVANAALFLASDEASFITGAVLPVDGGQLLNRG